MRFPQLAALLVLGAATLAAQDRKWAASWIAPENASPQGYGVYHLRHSVTLPSVPGHLGIRVSGDNRYQLFVNGKLVVWGPARGDLSHWRYEQIDLAPFLHAGKNVLAALVWNDGPSRAVAQVSNETAFVLMAEDSAFAAVNTMKSWRGMVDKAYSPLMLPKDQNTGYYALGPNEHVEAAEYPWGWESPDFDDSGWPAVRVLSTASDRYAQDAPNRWMLVPREIPLEERHADEPFRPRIGSMPATIAAHASENILLDLGHLTTGFPELSVSGGRGATVRMRYAETLYRSTHPTDKGNRNEIAGKVMVGPADEYVLDGAKRTFTPMYWRTYRYLRVEVQAQDEPVTIDGVRSEFTGYPFERKASFKAPGSDQIGRILDTGWRTARLCAHETYMDCPSYEQLQYVGDARIQMLVSLFQTGDARLMRNGIQLIDSSRTAEGATFSRAPSALQQYIPGFSLWWIGMVHDYYWYVDDPSLVRDMLPGVRSVLSFFHRYQGANGSLGKLPWWNFVDWAKGWQGGVPPGNLDGASAAPSDLQLLLAYDWAADLEQAFGSEALAKEDRDAARQLRAFVKSADWDEARGMFADQPEHRTYSQQTNTLAVLAHVVEGASAKSVVEETINDPSLTKSSIYFLAYTNATLREVGIADRYLDQLGPWDQMLSEGLTTLSEWSGTDARSDCHAWGASPNFEVFRTVAGIDSGAPGFAKVVIRPALGKLPQLDVAMPHPKGLIRLHMDRKVATVNSPVPGEFLWQGKTVEIRAGENKIPLN